MRLEGQIMRIILKMLNPFIWFVNITSYFGHLEAHRGTICSKCGRGKRPEYVPYDFSKDLKYF